MFDSDEQAYLDSIEAQLAAAEQDTLRWGTLFEPLLTQEAYQTARGILFEHYIHRLPAVQNSRKGMMEAFGQVKFRQGIQFVFDFIESTVAAKNKLRQAGLEDFS
jgi:hypothetical protein